MDERARDILGRAEAALAGLAAEAAAGRRYDEVGRLIALAGELKAMAARHLADADGDAAHGGDGEDADPDADPDRPVVRPRPPARPAAEKAKKYPKFVRDGDVLVKIGWSRRDRAEYEHRSPLTSLRKVAERAARLAAGTRAGGGAFTTDDLIPSLDAGGEGIPAYQSYLCLAFLRHAVLVEREGRSRYRVLAPGPLGDAAAGAFAALPTRRGSTPARPRV